MLCSPSAHGLLFAARVHEKAGLEGLVQAYRQPPRSSEQVLHPEKYLAETPDEPQVIVGDGPAAALGDGWTVAMHNVMGEFELRVLLVESLGEAESAAAAAGWDGSRYWFCTRDGAPDFFGMTTVWDTDADAAQFAAAWAKWASKRDGGEPAAVREVLDGTVLRGYDVDTKDGLVAVRFAGMDAFVADGVPPEKLAAVLASLGAVRRVERAADARPPPVRDAG